jgi:phospholipase/carboxylesterase
VTRPLIVALHGVGSSAHDMATALAPLNAVADIVTLDGTAPFDGGGRGRQWFSVQGITETNRTERVKDALPALLDRLEKLAAECGVAHKDLVLLGFSQGAIMTLAMIAQGALSGRAIAIADRLTVPPLAAGDRPARLLLVHDRGDPVMPAALSAVAGDELAAAGHKVDTALTDGVGHSIGVPTIAAITAWLAAS